VERIVILHTTSDARHCVEKGLHKGGLLLSTNPGADVYLKEQYGLPCSCISSFLSLEEILRCRDEASEIVDQLLPFLDRELAPSINKQTGFNMAYFVPLYGYLGKHLLASYLCFTEALKRIVDLHHPRRVFFYPLRFILLPGVAFDAERYFSSLFKRIQLETLTCPTYIGGLLGGRRGHYLRKLAHPGTAIRILSDHVQNMRFARFRPERPTILMGDLKYELAFVKKSLKGYNVIFYDQLFRYPLGFRGGAIDRNPCLDLSALATFTLTATDDNAHASIFLNDILKHFATTAGPQMQDLQLLRKISSRYPVRLAIFDLPPLEPPLVLVTEYLRSIHTKILIAQHGGTYGDSFYPWHFDSDFKRCDYFISYGFTAEDLRSLYHEKEPRAQILPLGKVKIVDQARARSGADILFPLANTVSVFAGGVSGRLPPRMLLERQLQLLDFLNRLKNQRVYVKPHPGSTLDNCAVLPVFKRLPNLKIVYNVKLADLLQQLRPRAVLIDLPSTALYEVIDLDTEIFVLSDPFCPFSADALSRLQKRVHYFETVPDVMKAIEQWVNKKLPGKRDTSFLEKYVLKANTRENILNLIRDLAS
jgi:hypothetical protein